MKNRPEYKWYVINLNTISIDSGWRDLADATARMMKVGGGFKVMTKPRVGSVVLDPNDDASWVPKRNNPRSNPRRHPGQTPYFGGVARDISDDEVEAALLPQRHPVLGHLRTPEGEQRPARVVRRGPEVGSYVVRVGTQRIYQVDSVDGTGVVICDVVTGECFRVPLDEFVDFQSTQENPASVVKTVRDKRLWEEAKASAEEQGRGGDWNYVMGTFLHMKHRTGSLPYPRENPGELLILNPEPDSARAEGVYQMWHQKEPHNISIRRPGVDLHDTMVCVGNAHNIVYRSGKWEQGRKTNDYVHHFDSKPKVWMLERVLSDEDYQESTGDKSVADLVRSCMNSDGQCAVADLATPISFGLDDGTSEGEDISIHSGARVYGAVDKKTVIIFDPTWKIVVIKGGKMHFDERGIVK